MDLIQLLHDAQTRSQDRADASKTTYSTPKMDGAAIMEALAQDDAMRKAQAARQQMEYLKLLQAQQAATMAQPVAPGMGPMVTVGAPTPTMITK